MICIKCGEKFVSYRKEIVCKSCAEKHNNTLGYLDGTSNITREDAEVWKAKLEKQIDAVNMLIAGKTLSEIAYFMGTTNQQASLFFSQEISKALRTDERKKPGGIKKEKSISYKPVWPENLYCAVFKVDEYSEMPPDALNSCEHVLSGLTERESSVLKSRFINEETLLELAETFGLTKERIRQIEAKALRKLRHPSRSKYLTLGISVQQEIDKTESEILEQIKLDRIEKARIQTQEAYREKVEYAMDILQKPIWELGLSVRSYNCLMRAGIETIGDLSMQSIDSLGKVRNLGKKSIEEVSSKCAKFGVILEDKLLDRVN